MSKGLNRKRDFRDQNFRTDFLKMAKTETVRYNFHATILVAVEHGEVSNVWLFCVSSEMRLCPPVLHSVPLPMDPASYQTKRTSDRSDFIKYDMRTHIFLTKDAQKLLCIIDLIVYLSLKIANTQESLLFPTSTMNAHAPFSKQRKQILIKWNCILAPVWRQTSKVLLWQK